MFSDTECGKAEYELLPSWLEIFWAFKKSEDDSRGAGPKFVKIEGMHSIIEQLVLVYRIPEVEMPIIEISAPFLCLRQQRIRKRGSYGSSGASWTLTKDIWLRSSFQITLIWSQGIGFLHFNYSDKLNFDMSLRYILDRPKWMFWLYWQICVSHQIKNYSKNNRTLVKGLE